MNRIAVFFSMLCLYVTSCMCSQPSSSDECMRKYMDSQSLVWEQMPLQWNEGAFLGNGSIGMVVYVDTADNSLTLWLSRPDVTDHRKAPNRKTSMGVKDASVMVDYCRMDIGKMKMFPKGKILSGRMVLDIYNAELKGVLQTDAGKIEFTAYTPYNHDVNIVETATDVPCEWKLEPGSPLSPRIQVFPHLKKELQYEGNPEPICHEGENEGWSEHKLLAGGDYATYWKTFALSEGGKAMCISTQNEVPNEGLSLPKAKKAVEKVMHEGLKKVKKDMYKWWHGYYQTGTICIPDKKMENFYHIQLYKLATCSRPEGPAMDVFGTFYKTSQWPGIWWNLNVQLTYMSTLPTNRLTQAEKFIKLMDESLFDILESKGTAKVGDFAWALHTYWSYMRYVGCSWEEIGQKVGSKAEGILEIYKPHLKDNGETIDLIDTESPEYEGFKVYNNSNYNLAALRWILSVLTEINEKTGMYSDKVDGWKNLQRRLHPAPVDENGYMIASNKPMAKSHRHYSHLLSFYPLKLQDPTDPATASVLEKSIDHWMNIGKGSGLAGYSYTGAASLYAFLGNGNKAYAKLYHFLNKPIGISILLPNTMYVECEGKNPVIETPLSAATAITEMLLQSWGETIRPFPAIPEEWKTCSFHKLRAEGGFDVSASMKEGKLEWIEISSTKKGTCRISLPEWNDVRIVDGNKAKMNSLGNGIYEIYLKKGQTVCLSNSDATERTCNKQIQTNISEKNFYGVKKGKGLKRQMDWPKTKL